MLHRKLHLQIKIPYFIVILKLSQVERAKLTFLECSILILYYIFTYHTFHYSHPLGKTLFLFKNREIKRALKKKYESGIYIIRVFKKTTYMICY